MPTPEAPAVDVIVPIHNGERYLASALESVLAQDYRPLRVTVVDDGSTDGGVEIARGFPEVRVLSQTNLGAGAARNHAIRETDGDLVAFLDQDDLWTADKLSVQVPYLLDRSELDFVFALQECFLEPGSKLPTPLIRNWVSRKLWERKLPGFLPGTLLVRRRAFDTYGLFDTGLEVTSDAEWFFRAHDAGHPLHVLQRVLLKKRFHSANHCYETAQSRNELLRIVRASSRRKLASG